MEQEHLKKGLWSTIICLIFLIGLIFTYVPQAASAPKIITWNVALWGGERDWTRPLHRWAEDMKKGTNGRWQINLHYGSVLGPSKEHLDGLKAGLFEAAQFCAGYAPGKTPLHTVAELPFIAPKTPKHMCQMVAAMWEHPAILKELKRWKAVPLIPATVIQFGLMGNKPIRTIEDFKGLRIRITGEQARVVSMFGAVPAMMPSSDFYEALERGTIDTVASCWPFSFGAFRLHEVSKYATPNFDPGSFFCGFAANRDAWNALPEELKKLHMEWYRKAPEVWGEEYKKGFIKWIPIFKKKGITIIELPAEDRAKLVSKAEIVYKNWIERMEKKGLPGREVFDYYMAKRKEIAGF